MYCVLWTIRRFPLPTIRVKMICAYDRGPTKDIELLPFPSGRTDILQNTCSYLSTCRKQGVSPSEALTLLFRGESPNFMHQTVQSAE